MANKEDIIVRLKQYLEDEIVNKNSIVDQFSNDVINLAYQKLSANMQDIITEEEDPAVISELLKSFLETTKMIDEKGLQKKQLLVKLFEQLNKYEQSRYS